MRTSIRFVLLWSLPLTASVACESEYSVNNVCLTSVKAQCHFEFECCTETERQVVGQAQNGSLGTVTDEESCIDLGTKLLCQKYTAVAESVNAGRFAYDEKKAAGCWDPVVVAADKCDAEAFLTQQQRTFAPVCDPFAGEGLVEEGAFCFVNEECKDSAQCVVAHNSNVVTALGKCGPPGPPKGSPCPPDGFCGEQSVCSGFLTGEGEGEGAGPPPPPPPSPVCEPLQPDGASCANNSSVCESGLCGGDPPICGKGFIGGEILDICHGPR